VNLGSARSITNLALIAFIGIILIITVASGAIGIPDEDAAILYGYSRNLAETGIISYIPGGARAEGATDFGWMIAIACLQKLGVPNHFATGALNAFFLLLFGQRLSTIRKARLLPSSRINLLVAIAFFLGIFFITGSAISGLGGFSTIAQMSLLGIIFSSCLFEFYDTLFIFSSIFYVLLRPDSIGYYTVIVASFLFHKLIFERRESCDPAEGLASKLSNACRAFAFWNGSGKDNHFQYLRRAALPLLVFAVYWPLRAWYFGRSFPLPYYVKQVHDSGFPSFVQRLSSEFRLNGYNNISIFIVLMLSLMVCMSAPRIHQSARYQASKASPGNKPNSPFRHLQASGVTSIRPDHLNFWMTGFLCWLLFFVYQSIYLSKFNLIQNIWDRFHAPLLGVTAAFLSCFLLVNAQQIPFPGRRSMVSVLVLATLLVGSVQANVNIESVKSGYKEYFNSKSNNNIYHLSLAFAGIQRKQVIARMFATEAGRLSYYSRIPTVDTWGLNTPEYSIAPLQNSADVSKHMPDIINMHVDFSRLAVEPSSKSEDLRVGRNCKKAGDPETLGYCGWHQMNQAIYNGARDLDYWMYVVPFWKSAKPTARHDLFMVNPASPAANELESALLANHAIPITDPVDLKKYHG
jgi:hypothetical protein